MLDPNIAVVSIGVGIVLVCVEFVRVGWVVPGVAGGVAILVGLASLARNPHVSPLVALAVLAPVCVIVAMLLRVARRARRNKAV